MKLHSLYTLTLAVAAGSLVFTFGAFANDDNPMMDTNKDGVVTASEHEAYARLQWSKMDPENDGSVELGDADSKYHGLDADKDGMITSAEYESGSRSMFSKWDTNGDGNLSASEIQAGDKR
jgi:EF hand